MSGTIAEYVKRVRGCVALDGGAVLHEATGADAFGWDVFATLMSASLHVDAAEAMHLRDAAFRLNSAVRAAAVDAGVHFVDVLDASAPADLSFLDHSPCHEPDPWVFGAEFEDIGGVFPLNAPVSAKSFHPNRAGHSGYAAILEQFIRDRIAAGAALSEAGLPANPAPRGVPGSGSRGARSVGGAAGAAGAAGESGRQAGDEQDTGHSVSADTAGLLIQRRASAVSGCGSPFAAPGGQVRLTAGGFAAGAAVSFTARAASTGSAVPAAPTLADATAGSDGNIDVTWTVPAAPAADADAAPRGYAIDAAGDNPGGGTHTARMVVPIVAYPAAAPCAVADTASTTLGQSVSVPVLANDVAPTGGSLDRSTVEVRAAAGGTFTVNGTSGAVTFTPDAGFWGTVETTYAIRDGWGIGVETDLRVTVDAGCTVTGAAGAALIEGTEGNDVICVPDRDDRYAFHIIDAKGGDDTVLGGAGVEWVYGGDGEDTIYGNGGDDRIIAGAGLDTIRGGPGMDIVYSADTADTVLDDDYETVLSPTVTVPQSGPEPRDDWVWADASQTVEIDVLANDHDPNEDIDPATLRIAAAPTSGTAEVVEDADGRAVVSYTAPGAGGTDSFSYETCDALGNCAEANVTVIAGTSGCTITGTAGDDTIRGTPGNDVICGLGGADTIRGIGGDDVIIGGAGDDDINAGNGADIVWGGPGDDTLEGGPGEDTIWGGPGDDTLTGSADADRLHGGDGGDDVSGGGGGDLVWGGAGDDTLDGHAGDDTVWGGPGNDTIRGGNGDDSLWGGLGADTLTAGAGEDTLHGGPGDDTLYGNTQNDTVWGGPGDDTLDGGGHDDELHGGAGADTLRGGAGADRLWGGIDADTLDGGNGINHLDGGPGDDTCTRADSETGCGAAGRAGS